MILLGSLAALLGVGARAAMMRVAGASSTVDHFYWMLMAEAYRQQRGLPVRLDGKYLLEDEEQAYPPLFGLLLGRAGLDRWPRAAVSALEAIQALLLTALLLALGAPASAVLLGVGIYVSAPVLVVYNTQLNSRILGDIFLFALLAAEACAAVVVASPAVDLLLWSVAALLTALVVMTHKMTLQLYAVLLLPWSWALGSAAPLLVAAAGAAIYVALVGPRFARYQFAAHAEIVAFWNRHWRWLGAHQFRDSPVYGGATAPCATCFHQPGWRGIAKHVKTVAAYAPVSLVLPVASTVTGVWPPSWLMVWVSVVYLWALATLLISPLKCLGGGHLYVFNAVAPAACYVAWLPDTPAATTIVAIGVGLTAVSLIVAFRVVRNRPTARDAEFGRAVSALGALPPGRVAVFPLQSAEAVASATHHAVLWGGHGYGFSRMEGFFPVLRQPLSRFLGQYRVDWVLSDDRFWPRMDQTLRDEGVRVEDDRCFGAWRLTALTPAAVGMPRGGCVTTA